MRRLGGVKSQSASQRWKKKQKKEEEPTKVRDNVPSRRERVQEIVVYYELGAQEQSTEEDKQLLERLTGLADQLVAIGDYSILSCPVYENIITTTSHDHVLYLTCIAATNSCL